MVDLGFRAPDGAICQRGAGPVSALILTGTTNFPIATCLTLAFPVHDLDCDIDTIIPDTVSTELPTVTGREFFRVHVGASSSVTISTTGEVGRDLDLYAGGDGAIGQANPAFYGFSSTTFESSTESITIDLTTFNPGQFVSVFVAEQSEIVEKYTITVSCN